MYVRDVARGGGAAGALLARIEREAREAGFAVLRLETGARQTAALRFYERAGFQPCAAFGAYATMAPLAVPTSVFLQKQLGRVTNRSRSPRQLGGLARLRLSFVDETAPRPSTARPARAKVVNCSATSRTLRRPCGSYHL